MRSEAASITAAALSIALLLMLVEMLVWRYGMEMLYGMSNPYAPLILASPLFSSPPLPVCLLPPQLAAATDCAAAFASVGEDFWMVTPCASEAQPG